MFVILNSHWDNGWLEEHPTYSAQDAVNKKQKAYWTQIANYFKDYDEHLLFAGTNEVHQDYNTPSSENIDVQESYLQTFIDAVRATGGNNASRTLLVQTYNTNIWYGFDYFTLPNDTISGRLMVEVHHYDPYDFTLNTNNTCIYWGAPYPSQSACSWAQESYIDDLFSQVKAKWTSKGIPVVMGEYGAIKRSSLNDPDAIASREYWLQYNTKAAEDNGIIPIYWDNGNAGNNGMALFDRNTGAIVDQGALNALMGTDNGSDTNPIAVTGVAVNPASVSVAVGAVTTLSATVSPSSATNKSVTWRSSDTSIATVDASGKVTGVAAGSATITVATQDGNRTADCAVTVTASGSDNNTTASCDSPTAAALPLTIDGAGDFCRVTSGDITNINSWNMQSVEINGKDFTNAWSNQMPARINGNYTIHYVGKYAWSHLEVNGSGGSADGGGGDTGNVAVTAVSVSPTNASVAVDATTTLAATVSPENAANKALSWSSSDTGIATVSADGVVTGVATGSTVITATTADGGFTATSTVTVSDANPNPTPTPTGHADNPFMGASGYINPDYTAHVLDEAQSTGGTLGAQMAKVADYSTAVWLDRIAAIQGSADVMGLRAHLDDALAQQNGGTPLTIMLVIYDLPNRDCAAAASNGELLIADDGLNRYKTEYIDPIVKILSDPKYSSLRIVTVVEPDSLPNLVTNLSIPACAEANSSGAYIDGIRYAIDQLHPIENVYIYLDIAHSGWLGWDSNFGPAVQLYMRMLQGTAAGVNSIDGFITNTANYTPIDEVFLPDANLNVGGQPLKSANFYEWNPYFDEKDYAAAMRDAFINAGMPSSIGMLIENADPPLVADSQSASISDASLDLVLNYAFSSQFGSNASF
jgi:uncharacterized protein YjdB